MRTRFLLLVLALIPAALAPALLPPNGRAEPAEAPKLDPDAPYTAEQSAPVVYDVDFAAVVTPPNHAKVLKVWLPLPQSDSAQVVEDGELSTFPMQVDAQVGKEKTFGNQFAYFEFRKPQGAQMVRHKFKITVHELHWNLNPEKVVRVEQWPDSFAPYLRNDQSVVVDDRLRMALKEAAPESHGQARDLTDAMEWVESHMVYDHAQASLRASSEHALEARAGHCSDYHGLCAAFGRALGVPTRVTYGINPFPKNSPSHCKLEAFLPPYGWVSFDVSETQNLINAIKNDKDLDDAKKDALIKAATARLLHGFRDNTWFLQTKGTDYDLAPPAANRVAVVRTIYAEADGAALPDPDPANPKATEFAWMTLHKYTPDKAVKYPFKDWSSLNQ
jgi:transglutaminase-like putative cysteine protease